MFCQSLLAFRCRMLSKLIFLLGLVQCRGDVRVTKANLYMDQVFLTQMPKAIASAGLEPVSFPPLSIAVRPLNSKASRSVMPASTWNFDSIVVSGLSRGVGRAQNCSRLAIRNGNITVACDVSFEGVQISLEGSTSWADSKGAPTPARIVAHLAESSAIVVAAGPLRYKPGSLMRFDVIELEFSLVPYYAPLASELTSELRSSLRKLLETDYRSALESAVSAVNIPAV